MGSIARPQAAARESSVRARWLVEHPGRPVVELLARPLALVGLDTRREGSLVGRRLLVLGTVLAGREDLVVVFRAAPVLHVVELPRRPLEKRRFVWAAAV